MQTGRVIIQTPYLSSIRNATDLIFDALVKKNSKEYVVERDPTQNEMDDLLSAWYVNIAVRSNGIVLMKNGVSVAIGTGQQERVGALEQAITKAYQKAFDREKIIYDPLEGAYNRFKLSSNPLEGAVCASDGFFPFRDSIDLLHRARVSAVIQPGASIRDYEVIEAVNQHKMAMAFTLERCFAH